MKNKIIPIVVGVISGFVIIRLFDFFSHEFYSQDVLNSLPAPTEENREIYMKALSEMIAKLPLISLLLVMAGWTVAGFVGGAVAAKLTDGNWKTNTLTVGFILFLATLSNVLIIPHPLWMTIIGLSSIVPFSYLGGILMGKKQR